MLQGLSLLVTSLLLEVKLQSGLAIKLWGAEVNIQEPYSRFCDDERIGIAACFVFRLHDQVIDYLDFSYSLICQRRRLDNETFNRVTNIHLCLLYFPSQLFEVCGSKYLLECNENGFILFDFEIEGNPCPTLPDLAGIQ